MTVDGKEFAKKTIPHTIPMLMAIDESFDIGSDTRTGVDEVQAAVPFHRDNRQADLQTRAEPNDGGGRKAAGTTRPGHGLAGERQQQRKPSG